MALEYLVSEKDRSNFLVSKITLEELIELKADKLAFDDVSKRRWLSRNKFYVVRILEDAVRLHPEILVLGADCNDELMKELGQDIADVLKRKFERDIKGEL